MEDLLRSGGDGGGPAALGYLAGKLLNFDRGAAWDAQRIGGQNRKEYVNYATIAIGLYAAAADISRTQILEIENLRARTSQFARDTTYDTVYPYLPVQNVKNTDTGYQLYRLGLPQ